MRQAIELIAKRKPLVIAMGATAGSGGYLVATPGQWIVARPGTLTGSIGVLTGKLVTGGLFSKLLVNRETVAFGQHVTLEGDDDPFTDEERKIVQQEIERVYELFLEAVAASRHMTRDQVHPMAAGRVWTGSQALELKLVDELGPALVAILLHQTIQISFIIADNGPNPLTRGIAWLPHHRNRSCKLLLIKVYRFQSFLSRGLFLRFKVMDLA